MALQLSAQLLAGRAVREGDMVVGDVVEEVDLLLLEHQGRRNGVHGSIAPAFVEKATVLIKALEVVNVGLRAQPL